VKNCKGSNTKTWVGSQKWPSKGKEMTNAQRENVGPKPPFLTWEGDHRTLPTLIQLTPKAQRVQTTLPGRNVSAGKEAPQGR